MKVTLLISTLEAGGAERVVTQMANYWVAKGWEVSIITLTGRNIKPHYFLDERVNHIPLGLIQVSVNAFHAFFNNIKRLRSFRQAFKSIESNITISFGDRTNVLVLLSLLGSKNPIIISERSNPLLQPIGRGWAIARELLYSKAKRLVIQTQEAAELYSNKIQKNIAIVPNPINLPKRFDRREMLGCQEAKRQKRIIAMGRLTYEKGFDLLIEAFSKIALKHPDWVLEIWGKGPLESDLSKKICNLGVQKRIFLCGQTSQPFEMLRQADLFVLSSRWEGFPNVLLEAMACGLPVISFDCPFGPSQIVRVGLDGVLVSRGDIVALAEAMDRLMQNDNLRSDLARNAQEVTERYGLVKVMDMWEAIISDSLKSC